jgi:hypothetical protein
MGIFMVGNVTSRLAWSRLARMAKAFAMPYEHTRARPGGGGPGRNKAPPPAAPHRTPSPQQRLVGLAQRSSWACSICWYSALMAAKRVG